MNILKAFGKSILFWFVSYLLIYSCFSIVTAVMASHADMDYSGMMLRAMPLFCMISAIMSTIGVLMYAKEIGLLQSKTFTENENYDASKVKWIHDEQQIP